MATHLQQLLRSVCWETEWDYAVFWKLEHRDRMVLTWEDGYYKNHNKFLPSENKSFNETSNGLQDGHFAHDSLTSAVTKMSSRVYSLGEGVIGQVAVTGKHEWIFPGEHAMNSFSSLELCSGLEAQVAAGIKTIVIAAVLPHGVIEFGSINEVNENLQFLDHIRDAFSTLQESVFQITTTTQFNHQHMLQMSDTSLRILSPDVLHDYLPDEVANMEHNPSNSVYIQSLQKHFNHSQTSTPYMHLNNSVSSFCKDRLSETINNTGVLPKFNSWEISELHEALGPTFLKQCHHFPREVENPENSPNSHKLTEATENSTLTCDSGNDLLLEASVANFCHSNHALKKSDSFSTCDSKLTTEKMPRNSRSIRSSTNKKRARPGENSRPRPRDRQLIEDRIKELRELVPNGSKCSIDSLLKRTIKHLAFMQNVTKPSDKRSDTAKSKGCSKMGVQGSGDEQGSSWAVEVGGDMKICPILVKNLSINGQMLVEMLCDNCDQFLEITDAIRSLGLTILKSVTDRHGDKTWLQFVVEGQSSRKLHRMDVLLALLQILQPNTIL